MPIYKMQGKKDGKQKYRVRINYIDTYGNARQTDKVAYGLDEAKALEMRLNTEIKQDSPVKKMTVKALFDEYIISKRGEVRETTLDISTRNINNYIIPELGRYKLDRLTAPVLQKWKNNINDGNYALQTKKKIYAEFRAMLNYAVKLQYIPKNPLTTVGNFKDNDFTKPADKIRYYTAEQFKKYIGAAKEIAEKSEVLRDWNYYVFFCIAYYTGMRKGEINALKWSDVDDDIIHVRRSVAQKIKGKKIVETPPKNKTSYRDLQMPIPLIKVLDDQKKRHKEYYEDLFTAEFRVCGGSDCLSDTSIDNHNRKYAEAAELPRITVHEFRHSHASLLANEGINIQEIARRLGHSKIEMTWNTYSHLYPREEERAISILNKIV